MSDPLFADDPIAQLGTWLDDARGAVAEPRAMTLATATPDGRPSARVVLLRGLDEHGLTFFTNRTSRKSDDLRRNPRAAVAIHWWELGRQVRVEGIVVELSAEESTAYWETRPRGSQLAAWASPQSQPLQSRSELDALVAGVEERFAGVEVPLPPFWGGYRLVPETVELWVHRDDRLHDRIHYTRTGTNWRSERLAP
ncbi:MAG: pyridoxamine 5'-phosphate oxidase [Gaiellaceae bacterium]